MASPSDYNSQRASRVAAWTVGVVVQTRFPSPPAPLTHPNRETRQGTMLRRWRKVSRARRALRRRRKKAGPSAPRLRRAGPGSTAGAE